MGIEGELNIKLTLAKKQNKVSIQSTRPVHVCRVFTGKGVSESLSMLPLLFNICGVAQACAGVRACEQAMAMPVTEKTERIRDALVNMETLREHLWRLFLEWPAFTETSIEKSAMAEMVKIQHDFQQALCPLHASSENNSLQDVFALGGSEPQTDQALLERVLKHFAGLLQEHVFSMPPAQWLSLNNQQALANWAASETNIAAQLINQIINAQWSHSGACQFNPLPAMDLAQLYHSLQTVNFVKQPQWLDQCCETSSLTRVKSPLVDALKADYGNGLLTRLVARLTEIAQLFLNIFQHCVDEQEVKKSEYDKYTFDKQDRDKQKIARFASNQGIGQVAAARGQLVHRVKIDNERIEYYQILAPTEWNFHPQGVVVQSLKSLTGEPQSIEKQARLLINAIDPCVAYKFQMTG